MLYNLCFFLILYIIGFIVFLLMYKRRLKKNQKRKFAEINYIGSRFNLDKRKINYDKLIYFISMTNAFIIAFVCTVICILPVKFIWQMLIGFVMLFILMFLCYELIGIICVKKGWKKNGIKSSKNRS